jgi:cytochrome c-type biogenesis protein CcmE
MPFQQRQRGRWRIAVSCLVFLSFVVALRLTASNDESSRFTVTDLGIVLSVGSFFIFLLALLLDSILHRDN